MRLGIKMLNSGSGLNNLMYLNQVIVNPGDTATIMFQLVDLDQGGQRYIPASGSLVNVNLTSIDQSKNIAKIPTNPFTDDRSVWSFNMLTTESAMAAGVNMSVKLTQTLPGPVTDVKTATAEQAVIFGPQSKYSC